MTSSREEYRYVSVGPGIVVDGSIMPARDVAADGSWRTLRGEDVAFCLEAISERRTVVGRAVSAHDVGNAIRGSLWVDVCDGLLDIVDGGSSSGAFVRGGLDFGTIVRDESVDGLSGFADIGEIYGRQIRPDSLSCSPADFEAGKPLRADAVRRVFHDLAATRTFWIPRRGNKCMFDVTAAEDRWGGSRDVMVAAGINTSAVYNRVFHYWASRLDLEMVHGTAWSRSSATDGTFWADKPAEWGDLVSGGSVRVIVEYTIVVYRNGSQTLWKTVLWSAMAAEVDGKYVLSASQMVSGASAALDACGVELSVPPAPESLEVQVIAYTAALVGQLGDHTDMSSIGWTWTPTPD